ncbi:glycoside hydrolase family protein [Echinicola sp. 20G]|uniref:glycoside hydrolase family protein n=1 Tax=Echinicola sp. 20G TaxID=2781961 RepID=UPI0019104D25|nr:glycoside hydrolase family protein [Echinicola sp. 20G]
MRNIRFLVVIYLICQNTLFAQNNPFYNQWEPSPKEGAFQMEDYIVWGGSVIKGEDGLYYMFASRWPKHLGMSAWVTNSEIVLAVADKPEGPFSFKKVVLPARGKQYWDGMMTHNPNIHYHDGKYILFYIGLNYEFDQPEKVGATRELYEEAWNHKRIGVAVADSPFGPWKRMDAPILQPRPGKWDGAIISNPAPVIHEDGSVLLIYKSAPVPYPARNQNRTMNFGVATASHYWGPYERKGEDNQIKLLPISSDVEDPYIWYDGSKYHMLAKCMNEAITGESGAGFLASSEDGLVWKTSENPIAYSRNITFSNGEKVNLPKLERPQVLIQNGQPSHVYFACRNPEGQIFNMVRPLRRNQ